MKDYGSARVIIEDMFGKYFFGSNKLPRYSPVDMTFSACTMTDIRKYGLEIKSTPKRTYLTEGFILKVSKYISMMKWARESGHMVYIIYLCTDLHSYYIFDVGGIVLSMDNLDTLNLKLRQFDPDSPSTLTAVIKLRPCEAIKYGEYDPEDGIDWDSLQERMEIQVF